MNQSLNFYRTVLNWWPSEMGLWNNMESYLAWYKIQREGRKRSLARALAYTIKNLPAMQETQVQSLSWEDPLEKGTATHSSIVPGKCDGQRSLAGYSPWCHKESDMTKQLTLSLFTNHGREEMKGPCGRSTGGVEAFPLPWPLSLMLILQGLAYAVQTVEVLIRLIWVLFLLVPYIPPHLSHVGLTDVLAFPPDN